MADEEGVAIAADRSKSYDTLGVVASTSDVVVVMNRNARVTVEGDPVDV